MTYTKLNRQVNVAWIADLKVDLRSTKKYIYYDEIIYLVVAEEDGLRASP